MLELFKSNWEKLFTDNKEEISDENVKLTKILCGVMSSVMLVLFILSILSDKTKFVTVYGITFIVMNIISTVSSMAVKKENRSCFAESMLYISVICMYMFSLYIIFFSKYGANQFSYLAMIIIMPLIIVDRPLKKAILQLLAIGVFSIFLLKSDRFEFDDKIEILLNFLIIGLAAYMFGVYISMQRVISFDKKRRFLRVSRMDAGLYLYSRRSFFEDMAKHIRRNTVKGLVIGDVNKFKMVNDTYGHDTGDSVLKVIAFLLKEFGENYNIRFYRYGGDEFIGIYTSCSILPLSDVPGVLSDIMRGKKIPTPSGDCIEVSMTIGYAQFPENNDFEACLRQADIMMYEKKRKMKRRSSDNGECCCSLES